MQKKTLICIAKITLEMKRLKLEEYTSSEAENWNNIHDQKLETRALHIIRTGIW